MSESKESRRICLNAGVLDFMAEIIRRGGIRVLEFGAGWSTLWLAERAYSLLSVETDIKWFRSITEELMASGLRHASIRFARPEIYRKAITASDGKFDIVLVDGLESTRFDAAIIGWDALRQGGWLLFDDAQRAKHRCAVEWLKDAARDSGISLAYSHGVDLESARDRLTLAFQKIA